MEIYNSVTKLDIVNQGLNEIPEYITKCINLKILY